MTQQKYENRFRKFLKYEGMGSVICIGAALYLLFHFEVLDTWYFILFGALAVSFLIGLPIVVLMALYRIKSINIIQGYYKDTILNYAKAKKNLLKVQRMGIYASYLFAVISLPLAAKLMNNKDLFRESLTWLWFLPVFVGFLYFFSQWAYKCYVGATDSAEELIRDLQQ